MDQRESKKEVQAANEQTVQRNVTKRRNSIEKLDDVWQINWAKAYEKLKARVRANEQRPFRKMTEIFKHKKTHNKGLTKNDARHNKLFAMTILYTIRGKLRPWR